MPIERSILLVEFDRESNRIRISRPVKGEARTILHTQYDVEALLKLGFSDAGRQIGEDILLSLEDLEQSWAVVDPDEEES